MGNDTLNPTDLLVKVSAKGRADVKIRNRVPVFRHWHLVWEIQDQGTKSYPFDRELNLHTGVALTSVNLDLGPVEVHAEVHQEINPENGSDSLILRIIVTALDGQVMLATKSWDLAAMLGGLKPGSQAIAWRVRASGRGVDLDAVLSVTLA